MFILIIIIFELNTFWSFKQSLSPKMLKQKPIILIFVFFMIISFIGIFFSNHILEGLRRFIRFSLFCLYCILFSKFLSKRSKKNKSLFLDTLIVLSIFLTSLAFLEYFGVFTDFFNFSELIPLQLLIIEELVHYLKTPIIMHHFQYLYFM